jgi:hypothetical protein
MLYLLDRGVSNSLDNNILFFAEPGNINIDTNLDSFLSELKLQDQKIKIYMKSIEKSARFRDENLNLLEQKFNAIKSNNKSNR